MAERVGLPPLTPRRELQTKAVTPRGGKMESRGGGAGGGGFMSPRHRHGGPPYDGGPAGLFRKPIRDDVHAAAAARRKKTERGVGAHVALAPMDTVIRSGGGVRLHMGKRFPVAFTAPKHATGDSRSPRTTPQGRFPLSRAPLPDAFRPPLPLPARTAGRDIAAENLPPPPNKVAAFLWMVSTSDQRKGELPLEIRKANIVAEHMCKLKRYLDALEVYRAIVQYDEDNVTALVNMAIILERVLGDEVGAIERYEQVLKIDPNDVTCLTNYARASYRFSGGMKHARQLFRRALGLDPGNVTAATNLAVLYVAENAAENSGMAEEMLRSVVDKAQDPHSKALALGNLAAVRHMVNGDAADAEQLYSAAITLEPSHALLRRNLALLLHEKFDECLKSYEEWIPSEAATWGQRAEEQYRAAMAICEGLGGGRDVGPTDLVAGFQLNLGTLVVQKQMGGRWEEGLALFRSALAKDSSCIEAALGVAMILWEREGASGEADEILKKTISQVCVHRTSRLRNAILSIACTEQSSPFLTRGGWN